MKIGHVQIDRAHLRVLSGTGDSLRDSRESNAYKTRETPNKTTTSLVTRIDPKLDKNRCKTEEKKTPLEKAQGATRLGATRLRASERKSASERVSEGTSENLSKISENLSKNSENLLV